MQRLSTFRLPPLLAAFALTVLGAFAHPAAAQGLDAPLARLAADDFDETAKAVEEMAVSGDPRAAVILEALGDARLLVRAADKAVFIKAKDGLVEAKTGARAGNVDVSALAEVSVNNRLRRAIQAALGGLTLFAGDPAKRLQAAEAVFRSKDPASLKGLEEAIAKEKDSRVRRAFEQARAAVILVKLDAPEADRIAAVEIVRQRGDEPALSLLSAAAASGPEPVRQAALTAVNAIQATLAWWSVVQNAWYGISLGSVLLLAAIGLAITFGVMGVINMAHGEMVMLGAYTTFVVQEIIRTKAPGLFDASVVIAVPLAFLVAGAAGVAIERGVIRFLYGRPLETLLATWGISLILQQTVRTYFGASNREVGSPSWMSGAFPIGGIQVTYNRLWIIVFSMLVFGLLLIVLKATNFGLQMRAVTQNRPMAGAMGIRTNWIDALTFGLGSGIAGIAGVALSQIDNVSPNLGQGYIIDSFLVVVFGGVGNLWGTLLGALTLGIANKYLEPFAGAVLGKILLLVFIILFIQKRPRGMFALRGRAAEA